MIDATVILPTHNHGRLLFHSVASLQRQTLQSFELFIMGDGVTDQTRQTIEKILESESRARFFDHPKSPRTGEPHRHTALQEAKGSFVCYLPDDDLWLPNHLETIGAALQEADFAHTITAAATHDGPFRVHVADWSNPFYVREHTRSKPRNGVPLGAAGHRLDSYHRLPHGWRQAPPGMPTDLHMWRQWLKCPGMKFKCIPAITLIRFPDQTRRDWPIEKREQELIDWLEKIDRGQAAEEIQANAIASLVGMVTRLEPKRSSSWRMLFG